MGKLRKRGVFGGSIEADGNQVVVGIQSDEVIDSDTGEVTLKRRSVARPNSLQCHTIRNREYARIREYVVGVDYQEAAAEAYRNSEVTPCWKPERSPRPDVTTTTYCIDCDGMGEHDGNLCRACGGTGGRMD